MSAPRPDAVPGGGDAGLFGPHSVTWRLHADPLLGIAGLRALFLQALHPTAMAGVAAHSGFRADPWGRLLRTAEYVGTVTYAPVREAERAAARVRGVHRRYGGADPLTGAPYRVDDPDLLLWVHVSMVESFLSVPRRGGAPVTDAEADAYVGEQVRLAELVGVPREEVPRTVAEVDAYLRDVRPLLAATDEAREAARFVLLPPMPTVVALATPARPAWASAAGLALAALPGWARRLYGLPGLAGTDAATTLGLRALRTTLAAVPPALRDGPHLKAAQARLLLPPA